MELERAIREANDAAGRTVVSDQTLPAAELVLDALAERIGTLDTVSSVAATTAQRTRQTRRRHGARDRGRGFVHAPLQIDHSGDGATPAAAGRPCLVGNERAFVQTVLGARGVRQPALLDERDRHDGHLTLTMSDGSGREVFFDITGLFIRNGEALMR